MKAIVALITASLLSTGASLQVNELGAASMSSDVMNKKKHGVHMAQSTQLGSALQTIQGMLQQEAELEKQKKGSRVRGAQGAGQEASPGLRILREGASVG